MKVPGIETAIVEQTRIAYLLDPDNKGGVFLPLGFTLADWQVFRELYL